jgi:hypothetical protein
MVEIKEFKSIALSVCQDLSAKGALQPGILTKAVLETASGVRMWQALRSLSDYCLSWNMQKTMTKAQLKTLPIFTSSTIDSAFEEENSDPNLVTFGKKNEKQQ